VLRKNAALLVALALGAAACSGGDRPSSGAATTSTVAGDPNREVPAELLPFLERAAAGADQAFTAEYAVLRKLGGTESTVLVEQAPPALRITVDDLVVVDGPTPATCRPSTETCDGRVREEQLSPFGVFTRFATTGPVEAVRNLAQRADASPPRFSERTAAGVPLECVAVPVQDAVTAEWCLTPEGVFGFVDNPSVRYELTRYEPGPPAGPVEPPYPVTD
jgi:hypothetical protein